MFDIVFNVGDRIRCVYSEGSEYRVTLGKIYEVEAIGSAYSCGSVNIIDDRGLSQILMRNRFESVRATNVSVIRNSLRD